jgi:hypothetical protein
LVISVIPQQFAQFVDGQWRVRLQPRDDALDLPDDAVRRQPARRPDLELHVEDIGEHRRPIAAELADLRQRQAEILERDDGVQPDQLVGAIQAPAFRRARRLQQLQPLVHAQRAHRESGASRAFGGGELVGLSRLRHGGQRRV